MSAIGKTENQVMSPTKLADLHQAASSPGTLKTEKIREAFLNDLGPFEILSSFLSLNDQIKFAITGGHYWNMYKRLKSDEKSLIETQLNNGNIEDRDRFDDILNRSLPNAQITEEIYRRAERQALAMSGTEPEISINGFKKFLISDYPEKKAEGNLRFTESFLRFLGDLDPLSVAVQDYKSSVNYESLTTIVGKVIKINQTIENYIQENIAITERPFKITLENTRIVTIPNWLRHLNVIVLNLGHNSLTYLPSDLFRDMGSLKVLNLSHNLFERLPPSLFGAKKLQSFSVEGNKLTELPRGLLGNEELLIFNAKGNKITEIPRDFLQGTRKDILQEVQLKGNRIRLLDLNHPFLQVIKSISENIAIRGDHIFIQGILNVHSSPFDSKEILPSSLKSKALALKWKVQKKIRAKLRPNREW